MPCLGGGLRVGEDLLRQIVDDDGAIQVGDDGFGLVFFPDEGAPGFGVHGVGFGAGVPQVDAADGGAVFREHIVFAE